MNQNQNNQYYNNLIDDDEYRNKKRRESYLIPVGSLDGKKNLRSPMKSSAQAFVPKKKDVRTGSMPNIFYPIGGPKTQSHVPVQPIQEGQAYYQFDSQPGYPIMQNYNYGMPSGPANPGGYNISANNVPGAGLVPPMMDYNYEERRNSGTTGGSSNMKGKQDLMDPKAIHPKHKKTTSGQGHNKGRRSSNTSNSNLVIPTNEKNVMEYKGQIVAFAKNQQGSKYLQRVLAKASPDVLEFVVIEVGNDVHELMVDSYGNYF